MSNDFARSITRVTAAAFIASAAMMAGAPGFAQQASAASPTRSVKVSALADKTINHNGKRERVTVSRVTVTYRNYRASDGKIHREYKKTSYRVTVKRTAGKLPKAMPRCEYEDASGARDLRAGCTYRGTSVAGMDYALPLKVWGVDGADGALILYVSNDGRTAVSGW